MELWQIIKIQDFEFQAIGIGGQEGEVLDVFPDLGGFHGDAQDAIATPVGRVGESAIATTCIQRVDSSVFKISGKKAIAAASVQIETGEKQPLGRQPNPAPHRPRTHSQTSLDGKKARRENGAGLTESPGAME
jgi:hypothetical protein